MTPVQITEDRLEKANAKLADLTSKLAARDFSAAFGAWVGLGLRLAVLTDVRVGIKVTPTPPALKEATNAA